MTLTSEQEQVAGVVRAALREFAPGGARFGSDPKAHQGNDSEAWTRLARDLALAGLLAPARLEGSDGGLVDAAVVSVELGRALVHTPFIPSSVHTVVTLSSLAPTAESDRTLTAISTGASVCVPVRLRPDAADDLALDIDGDTARVSGATTVLSGGVADVALLAAGSDGVWVAQLRGAHATWTPVPGLDPTMPLGRIELAHAPAVRVAGADEGSAGFETGERAATTAVCGEMVGIAEAALDLTLDYVRSREQFGSPIGAFQAVQHACADMLVRARTARATAMQAAAAAATTAEPGPLVAAAYTYCADSAAEVVGSAIQLHGGIGYTWEHPAQHYFKRVTALRALNDAASAPLEQLLFG